jgi:Fe-S cluster biogenesis protein NfuA
MPPPAESDALITRVKQVLASEVAPLLEMDGTQIEVLGVEDGVVRVRLGGAAGCCPGSIHVLIRGVEDELRRRVPGVEYLEAIP